MKKFINTAETMVAESLAGFVAAHEDIVVFDSDRKFVRRRDIKAGKVALVSGGGSGHEPLHVGFVGRGMLDAACQGHVFTSPTPDQIVRAIEATDTGAGCLLIVKNYDGDVMNFEMAAEMAADRHKIETVLIGDDVEAAGLPRSQGRRGVAGAVIVEKILGAAAERGAPLETLKALGDDLAPRIRTMGVALTGVTVPQTQRKTFALGPDEMEMGVGIHGEPGQTREPFRPADDILRHLCETIVADLPKDNRKNGLLLINGLGATPPAELYLAYNAARRIVETHGIAVRRSLVGTYVTSLDMSGLSVTLCLLSDDELSLWDAPVNTAALRWGE
ncbi:dihydroxyacetone kinase subunit DhaK [Rhizobium sp. LjRoot30]|uniref:dihydroxyacetone kinase subunit DhaK n=1 Tax=Rhizobium sp. LjRoot30 TaxID=3342320 RepID=UPI003ED1617E